VNISVVVLVPNSNCCCTFLAKQVGVEKIVVFINKADIVENDVLELVEIEIRDLLCDFGYDGNSTPVICGSALLALNGDKESQYGEKSILELLAALDSYVPLPTRDLKSPFLLPIDNSFTVPGRGTVVVGTLQRGTIKKNLECEVLGFDAKIKTTIGDVQVFRKSVEMALAGDNVGVLIRGVKASSVSRGMVLCQYGSEVSGNHFEAKIYFLTKNEGGRSKPIQTKYIQQLFSRTWNISCRIDLLPRQDMVMPGEHATVHLILLKKMVMNMGQQFTIRENNLVTATGIVLKPLDSLHVERTLGKLKVKQRE
jgi:elongation factor Tu